MACWRCAVTTELGRLAHMQSIVFDIGWVLLHLQPRRLLALLNAHGASLHTLEQVTSRIGLLAHESGRLDGSGLLAEIAALAPRPVPLESVHTAWVDMFDPQTAMFELAARLKPRYRIYLLSNVGSLHWDHLVERYRMHELGHDVLRSYEAGVMKPDPAIYALAEQRFGLEPALTVFLDDRAENVQAARERGWQSFVHRDYAQTLGHLRALGVEID